MVSALSPTRQALAVWPLFFALGLLMLGNGLQSSLIGLRADIEGFATATIGLVMAGYYAGFLFGSTLTPRIVSQVGHIRVYAGLASLASTATLAHIVIVSPPAWFLFRLVTGGCLAGLYVVAESWLNQAASGGTRGRVLAIYMVVVSGGLAGGQLLLATADPSGFVLFIVASLLVSLAVVPIALVALPEPTIPAPGAVPYRRILRAAPIGFTGAFITGASNGAVLALGAVWGANSRLSVGRIAILLTVAMLGGIVFQMPLGAISDRVSRRRVIFVSTSLAAAAAGWLTGLEPTSTLIPLAMFLLGGFSFPMYSLSATHVNDLVGPDLAVGASSAILLINGAGAVIGPIAASVVMSGTGPNGLWWTVATFHAALSAYALYRLVRVRSIPAPLKGRYVPYPMRSGGLIWATETERTDTEDPG